MNRISGIHGAGTWLARQRAQLLHGKKTQVEEDKTAEVDRAEVARLTRVSLSSTAGARSTTYEEPGEGGVPGAYLEAPVERPKVAREEGVHCHQGHTDCKDAPAGPGSHWSCPGRTVGAPGWPRP